MFGEESILLWSALLMKKRIVVVSEKLSLLQKLMRFESFFLVLNLFFLIEVFQFLFGIDKVGIS